MPNKNLSSVTNDLITSYGKSAKNVIRAYRLGNKRLARFVEQRVQQSLRQSASGLRGDLRNSALSAQKTVNGMYVKGIVISADRADAVVGKTVDLASRGVKTVASNAGRFEKRTGFTALTTVANAAKPAAVAATGLATKLEKNTDRLAKTLAGTTKKPKSAASKRVATRKRAEKSIVPVMVKKMEKMVDEVAAAASEVVARVEPAAARKAATRKSPARRKAAAPSLRKPAAKVAAVATKLADQIEQAGEDVAKAASEAIAIVTAAPAKKSAPRKAGAARKSRRAA